MSVFTALSLVFLFLHPQLALGKALPCPDCEVEPPPVIITTTEPCPHAEGCNHPHKPTPPPVIITEHCHEGCNHPKPPPTPNVLTRTISTCRKPSSIIPYTSGSTTYLFSSCMPSTMWYTQNATCESSPPSTIYQSITIPRATSVSTSISTATVYQNGTAPPAQTITLPGGGSVLTVTSYQYASTPSPLIITSYEGIPTTCPSIEAPPAQTTTIYESGTPPPAETVVLTSFESGVAPPAESITYTSIGPGTTLPAQTVVVTGYASGSPPATVTLRETSIQGITNDVYLTSTLVSTTTSLTTSKCPSLQHFVHF